MQELFTACQISIPVPLEYVYKALGTPDFEAAMPTALISDTALELGEWHASYFYDRSSGRHEILATCYHPRFKLPEHDRRVALEVTRRLGCKFMHMFPGHILTLKTSITRIEEIPPVTNKSSTSLTWVAPTGARLYAPGMNHKDFHENYFETTFFSVKKHSVSDNLCHPAPAKVGSVMTLISTLKDSDSVEAFQVQQVREAVELLASVSYQESMLKTLVKTCPNLHELLQRLLAEISL